MSEQTIRAIITGKKVQNYILGCSVQCRGAALLWFSAFKSGGGSQWPGALFTQWQDCLEWEQLLPHVLVAELYCSNLAGQGLWLMMFFSSTSAFLRWAGRIWREVLTVTEHEPQCAELHELLGVQKMEQVSCRGNSPANSSFQVWSQVTLYISGRKHVLWGQLGTKLQLQNAFWRSLSSLLEDREGPQGSLAQERSILPQSSLCFITLPPAMMGATKWRVTKQDAGKSKQDDVALFRFSPSGSS